jgi:hypothetical protein
VSGEELELYRKSNDEVFQFYMTWHGKMVLWNRFGRAKSLPDKASGVFALR